MPDTPADTQRKTNFNNKSWKSKLPSPEWKSYACLTQIFKLLLLTSSSSTVLINTAARGSHLIQNTIIFHTNLFSF